MAPLGIGTVLQDRYEITGLFGSAEGTAAYLADDRSSPDRVLIWESAERFKLAQPPPGARAYFQVGEQHYLVLRVEGQRLSFVLTAAGRMEETPAGMWLLQISRAIGYWHNRDEGALVALRQGEMRFSSFYLSSHDLVMIPSYGDLSRGLESDLAADGYRFAAPEQGEAVTPRSDVYALGAMLYCLLTGQMPPEPAARAGTRLVPPRRINRGVSGAMEKIVLKALQLNPARRYPTGAELAADLEGLLVPQLMEKKPEKKNPSLLMRALPFLVTLAILSCLVVLVQTINKTRIKLPKLPMWPTATYTPTVPVTPSDTPTATPTWTPAPTGTPLPGQEAILNQVRLDLFPEIVLYVSVLDQNREPVRGLGRDHFRVQQDGSEVADFSVANVDAAQDPLAIVVAVDVSGSMKGEPIDKAKEAAANFVSRFDAGDQVALVKFNHQIATVHDFSTNKDAVVQAIGTLKSGGDTALYDVIAHAVERLSAVPGRRAVIVLSDGRDTASAKHSVGSAIAAANASNIPVFVVGLDSPQFTPGVLEKIVSDTGGVYLFAPAPDALDALYQTIRGQLQNQYRIQFRSLHEADGAPHTVRIGVMLGAGREIWAEREYRSP